GIHFGVDGVMIDAQRCRWRAPFLGRGNENKREGEQQRQMPADALTKHEQVPCANSFPPRKRRPPLDIAKARADARLPPARRAWSLAPRHRPADEAPPRPDAGRSARSE